MSAPTEFSVSGLPSFMLEYRGSCFVLALKPGSIFFVASTTSSIESFCVVVNVCTWRENIQHTGRCTTTMTTPTNVPLNCRMSSQPRWTVDVHVACKKTSRLYHNSKGGLALSSSGNVQSILSDESPKETRPTPYLRKVYPIQSEWENMYLDAPVPKLYVGPPNPQHLFSICLRRRPSLVHPVCEVGQGVATLVAPPVVVAVGIDNSSCSSGWRGEGESDKRALQAYIRHNNAVGKMSSLQVSLFRRIILPARSWNMRQNRKQCVTFFGTAASRIWSLACHLL